MNNFFNMGIIISFIFSIEIVSEVITLSSLYHFYQYLLYAILNLLSTKQIYLIERIRLNTQLHDILDDNFIILFHGNF